MADVIAIPVPAADPAILFGRVAGRPGAMLLDGAADASGRATHSYVLADPVDWLEADAASADPFRSLERALARPAPRTAPNLPPFQGGLVGFLGYELGGRLERLPTPCPTGLDLPDLAFGVYEAVLAFDHRRGQAWAVGSDRRAVDRLAALAADAVGEEGARIDGRSLLAAPGWRAEQDPARYRAAIRRVLDYIRAGDIYQANYTQRFIARLAAGVTPWDAYLALRSRTAAPFSAFLDLGGGRAIASGSPERFLRLDADGRIETRPIKGTRPRGRTQAEDAALAAELLASEKDRAENLMIVDLLRNDLSRVAEVGSVRVPTLWGLESYRTVHHLTSVVQARLRPGLGPVDLLRACFPGGSITGAPKIRAMEIIHELEPCRRGPYCGSVAWIGWDGAMDSSIVIRTLAMSGGIVQMQAGGGIVADSDPDGEYEESLTKAKAILTALDPDMAWPPASLPSPAMEAAE